MLFEQSAPLTFGHASPDSELDPVVQRIRPALGDDRTVPADDGGLALRGAPDEQLVGVGRTTDGLGDPGDPGFAVRTLKGVLDG